MPSKSTKTLKALDQDETLKVDDDSMAYYSDTEESEASSDSNSPQQKSKNFEFTNNLYVMRLVRMLLCVEVLGVVVDTPSFYFPNLFKILCRPLLYYSIRFYSYPIVDVAYLIQYYLDLLKETIQTQLVNRARGGIEVTARRLQEDVDA